MALLSGEVETGPQPGDRLFDPRSGWLCYPGKLKLECDKIRQGSYWDGSGWLCYPGKLKLGGACGSPDAGQVVPDGFAIRGS